MKHIFLSLNMAFISFFCFQGKAQFSKGLSIGEQCPDLLLTQQIPAHTRPFHLTDLKGKLIIIDFWATWCIPCLETMGRLDSLQQQFGDSIFILAVTDEKESTVLSFLKNHPALKTQHLHILTSDTLLRLHYFPSRFLPHEVWVDKNGKYIAATEGDEVTAEHIADRLDGKAVNMPQKKDILQYNWSNSLLIDALGKGIVRDSDILSASNLTKGISGAVSVLGLGKVIGNKVRLQTVNVDINQIFQLAYGGHLNAYLNTENPNIHYFMHSAVVLDVKDSSLFYWPGQSRSAERQVPRFCYELQLPANDSDVLFLHMQKDLNNYFGALYGITAHLETRLRTCWALIYNGITPIGTKGGANVLKQDLSLGTLTVQNRPIKDMLTELSLYNFMTSPYLLVDETNYAGNVDLSINHTKLGDIDSLNSALYSYGLQFVKVERAIKVIVITDKKEQLPVYSDNL